MIRKLSARMWKIIAIPVLAIALVAGITIPAIAAPDEDTPPADNIPTNNLIGGRVTSIDSDDSSFTIQRGEQEPVTVSVDNNTRYFKVTAPQKMAALNKNRKQLSECETQEIAQADKPLRMKVKAQNRVMASIKNRLELRQDRALFMPDEEEIMAQGWWGKLKWPRRFGEKASFEDMAIGDTVVVRLVPGEGAPLAKQVIIIKEASIYHIINGTIGNISGNSITITNGSTVTLTYDENTRFILEGVIAVKKGQSAHAVYDDENVVKLMRVCPAD